MRGQPHSEETKAAVLAALAAGDSLAECSRRFGLNLSTIRNWKRQAGLKHFPAAPTFLSVNTVNAEKEQALKDEFGSLVATYLRQNLHGLIAQSEQFADRAWLREQTAADLALLHGIQCDKTIRLLEAAERAAERLERYDLPPLPAPDRELR